MELWSQNIGSLTQCFEYLGCNCSSDIIFYKIIQDILKNIYLFYFNFLIYNIFIQSSQKYYFIQLKYRQYFMTHRRPFFGPSFCQNLCIEDSPYDHSDGIIIQLVPKLLVNRPQPPLIKGLNITQSRERHESLDKENIQGIDRKKMKSSGALRPKKKIDLSYLNHLRNYHIDMTSLYQNCKDEGSTNMFVSVNSSGHEGSLPLGEKRESSRQNYKKTELRPKAKAAVAIELQQNEKKDIKLTIHKLGGKKASKENRAANQSEYFLGLGYTSAPTSPSRKRTFLDLNMLKRKHQNKPKSFF